MKQKVIAFSIETWAIGAVVFVVGLMLHLQHLSIGLILGIFNTFIIFPLTNSIILGNERIQQTHKTLLIKTLLNVLIAITISLLIRLIDYYLIKELIKNYPIEPFRFMFMYQIIYYLGYFSYKKLFNKRKGIDENEEDI